MPAFTQKLSTLNFDLLYYIGDSSSRLRAGSLDYNLYLFLNGENTLYNAGMHIAILDRIKGEKKKLSLARLCSFSKYYHNHHKNPVRVGEDGVGLDERPDTKSF